MTWYYCTLNSAGFAINHSNPELHCPVCLPIATCGHWSHVKLDRMIIIISENRIQQKWNSLLGASVFHIRGIHVWPAAAVQTAQRHISVVAGHSARIEACLRGHVCPDSLCVGVVCPCSQSWDSHWALWLCLSVHHITMNCFVLLLVFLQNFTFHKK